MSRFTVHSDAVVLPSDRALSIEPAAVVIDGHTIAEVRPGPAPDGCLALGSKVLAPAFVNAHTHLSMSAFRGIGLEALGGNVVEDLYFELESRYQPGDIEAFVRVAAIEALLTGAAVVWDHYYAAAEVARACRDVGIGAVIAPTLQDLEGPGVPDLERQIEGTLAIAGDRALADAGIVAALGPHATDTVSEALWGRIADLAAKHDLPLHFHCAQSREEHDRAVDRHGSSPIRWLASGGWLDAAPSSLLVHGLFVGTGDLAALDPSRVVLGYCPGSQIQYCFPAWYAAWRAAGFDVAVGTDCGACNDGMNVQQELKLVAAGPLFGVPADSAYRDFWRGDAVPAGTISRVREARRAEGELDPAALLASVWGVPGRLHPGLPCGRIEVGARANLLVLDADHPSFWPGNDVLRALALQDVTPAIDRMMVNGRWLSESGDHQRALTRSDVYRESVREARARLARLLG
ncbi:MAG: amidohydrolase family protein [Alphaproteobacteria bacterium]|nr:amidohydrolase family protein [Alphaproteobacteria bacterium]